MLSAKLFIQFGAVGDSLPKVGYGKNSLIFPLLTYMSIRDLIRAHVEDGKLFLVGPELPTYPVKRLMIVSEEIHDLIVGPWESKAMQRRCYQLHRQLLQFVTGGEISLGLIPYNHDDAYMGRLDKIEDAVWDIRARRPKPALRLFGGFAVVDWFVALLCAPRSVDVEWLERKPLKEGTSLEWQLAILECKQQWETLFPNHPPVNGETVDDYVSENAFAI